MNKAMTTATTEDFSFPIITDSSYPSPIDSPPLWHLSPAASLSQYSPTRSQDEDEGEDDDEEGKNASHAKSKRGANNNKNNDKHYNSEEEDEEEKMDTLWEDFNEELTTTTTNTINCSNYYYRRRSSTSKSTSICAGANMLQVGCVQALKLSRNGGANAIFSPRKQPGLVVFFKVLKKLFLLQHNSHHHSHGQPSSVKNKAPW